MGEVAGTDITTDHHRHAGRDHASRPVDARAARTGAPDILALCDAQRPDWSLARPFYVSDDLYRVDCDALLKHQWFLVAHASELADPSRFLVRDVLGESILVTRQPDGTFGGFFNVCTHRGSRICEEDGRAKRLTCPYHAWSFAMDGSLAGARGLPAGIDTAALALRPVAIRVESGLILACLSDAPPSLDAAARDLRPALLRHGIADARVAARRAYRNFANWKLVLENFLECYHCLPSHPEYSAVNGHVALGAGPVAQKRWNDEVAQWTDRNRDNAGFEIAVTLPGLPRLSHHAAQRRPIGGDHLTQTRGGRPVAPLMGRFTTYDGASTGLRFGTFARMILLNDYAALFHFNPRGVEETDVVITWLVAGHADPAAIDLDALTWLWDVTTIQDKKIVEDNAAGVRSMSYRPGPYTELEPHTASFVRGYLAELAGALRV